MIRLKGLQKALDTRGETQASLADKMGVSKSIMNLWVMKECKSIPADRIVQMSDILDVSIDFIFNGKEFSEYEET